MRSDCQGSCGFHFVFCAGRSKMAQDLSPPCIQVGKYLLQFEEEEMGEEFEERARKELRETPEVESEAIAAFKDLLRGEES